MQVLCASVGDFFVIFSKSYIIEKCAGEVGLN